jgi:hypothetical protein
VQPQRPVRAFCPFHKFRRAAIEAFGGGRNNLTIRLLRGLREEIGARAWVLWSALVADSVVLTAFAFAKLKTDPAVVAYAVAGIAAVFIAEWFYLSRRSQAMDSASERPAEERR